VKCLICLIKREIGKKNRVTPEEITGDDRGLHRQTKKNRGYQQGGGGNEWIQSTRKPSCPIPLMPGTCGTANHEPNRTAPKRTRETQTTQNSRSKIPVKGLETGGGISIIPWPQGAIRGSTKGNLDWRGDKQEISEGVNFYRITKPIGG